MEGFLVEYNVPHALVGEVLENVAGGCPRWV